VSNTVLSVDGLSKQYGSVTAVGGVSFSVSGGEAFGLVGPNGAGKSTTLDVLIGLSRPTDGSAVVAGHDVTESPAEARGEMGVVPENCGLYDRLTGTEHVQLAARAKRVDTDTDRLLRRVGLDETDWNRPAGTYSKGMAQRLRLAVALVGDPNVLVLDEPLSGLDPEGIEEITSLIRDIRDDGAAVVFSSHDLPYVERVCDRVGVLNDGSFAGVEDISGSDRRSAELVVLVRERPDDSTLETVESLSGVESVIVDDHRLHLTVTDPESKAEAITVLHADTQVRDVRIETRSLDSAFATHTADDFEIGTPERRDPKEVIPS
jgi:ABC-2 type transport system ATP-binding protein